MHPCFALNGVRLSLAPMPSRLFLLLILPIMVLAGVTGTLSGTVTDVETGAPLPGVQVVLDGTRYGAVCDAEGRFVIVNIIPGEYDLIIHLIGYERIIMKNVRVAVDLQTRIQAELHPTVLEGQTVVVESDQQDLKWQLTSSTRFIPPERIEELPVQSYQDLVNMQPGVAAGHIRGGRRTEVLYLVDGIPIQEVIEGKVGSELPNTAVIDISVQTGGFNAEYGDAMSGVVNILTKEGGREPTLTLQANTLISNLEEQPFLNSPSPLDQGLDLSLGLPLWQDYLTFMLSGSYHTPAPRRIQEQFGLRRVLINDPVNSSDVNLTTKLTSHLLDRSLKLSLQTLYSNWEWIEYDHVWRYNQAELPQRRKQSMRISLAVNHTLSPRLFYEITLSNYQVLKSILGSAEAISATPILSDSGYVLSGRYPWWMDHMEEHTLGKMDITHQATDLLQFKAGIRYTQYDLYKRNVMRRDLGQWSPGFPRYIMYDSEYDYDPRKAAFYLQGKYDTGAFITNIGVRVDRFDPRAERPAIEFDQTSLDDEWVIDTVGVVKGSVKSSVSPRIGIAWTTGENSRFHVNYGHFFQMPAFDYLFTNPNLNIATGFAPLGDPDLKPALTRAWEFGAVQQINSHWSLDATLFNKDVSNLIDSQTFVPGEGDYTQDGFLQYRNIGAATIRGIEVFVQAVYDPRLRASLAYTYLVAKGSSSHALSELENELRDLRPAEVFYPLSWDQRHTLVLDLELRLTGWLSANSLVRMNSALPYTMDRGVVTFPNNERMDPTSSVDIRFNGVTPLWQHLDLKWFLEATNLFDSENVLWVDTEGQPGGWLQDPGAWDFHRRYRLGIGVRIK